MRLLLFRMRVEINYFVYIIKRKLETIYGKITKAAGRFIFFEHAYIRVMYAQPIPAKIRKPAIRYSISNCVPFPVRISLFQGYYTQKCVIKVQPEFPIFFFNTERREICIINLVRTIYDHVIRQYNINRIVRAVKSAQLISPGERRKLCKPW